MNKPILVFYSDFTYKEGAVSSMYGVVKSVDASLEIVTGTHEIPQYDIWSASYRLYQSMRFWPAGTVFVSVVDPGVGTKRRASVARTTDGHVIVTPDNGTLTHIDRTAGIAEIREIDETANRLRGKGADDAAVFHGRDLFAFCAARFASGAIDFAGVGAAYPTEQIVRLPVAEPEARNGRVFGNLEIGDPNFGNVWSNVSRELFVQSGFSSGDLVSVTIKEQGVVRYVGDVPFYPSFGFVDKGHPVIYTNELSRISLAVSEGNFCSVHGVGYGPGWTVEFAPADAGTTADSQP